MVLFLFLAHLGLGIVFTLVFIPREAGVKFFRFNAGLAAVLLAAALGFLVRSFGYPARTSGPSDIGAVSADLAVPLALSLVATLASYVHDRLKSHRAPASL